LDNWEAIFGVEIGKVSGRTFTLTGNRFELGSVRVQPL
jgi:hypothetical protein